MFETITLENDSKKCKRNTKLAVSKHVIEEASQDEELHGGYW